MTLLSDPVSQGGAAKDPNNPQIGDQSPGGAFNSQTSAIPVDSLTTPPPTSPTLPPATDPLAAATTHQSIIAGSVPPPVTPTTDPNTPATNASTGFLSNISKLMGLDGGKAQATQDALDASGATALTKRQNELSSQLTALNTEAQAIPLKDQQNILSRGVTTTAGNAPIDTANLRNNAIKALSLKSEYDLNAGNLQNAKDTAQRAVDLKYGDIEAQIDQQSKLLQLYTPFMNEEQKAKADALTAQNQQKATDLADKKKQQTDVINAAQTNGDAASASKALSLDPNSSTFTQDLAVIQAGVAPKATDPLDAQYKQLQIQKLRQDISDARNTGSPTVSTVNDLGQTVNIPTDVAPYYNVSSSGIGYVDASTLQGTAKEKTAIINQAQSAGLKVITNKNTAADLVNIKDAKAKLDTVSTIMAGIAQPGATTRLLYGLGLTKLAQITQSDPQKAASGALESIGLDILKAISGVQGFRGNQSAIQQVTDHLPKVTDTVDTINAKVGYINQLISDREDAAVGKSQTPTTKVIPTAQIPEGYYQASDGLLYKK